MHIYVTRLILVPLTLTVCLLGILLLTVNYRKTKERYGSLGLGIYTEVTEIYGDAKEVWNGELDLF